MRTKAYDFRAFCQGELVKIKPSSQSHVQEVIIPTIVGSVIGFSTYVTVQAKTMVETAVPAISSVGPGAPVDIQHAFDPVITMLQQIAFPVASIVLAWACLQAMVGKPAAAVDRAKWAVLGYLAMRYAPEILRHV